MIIFLFSFLYFHMLKIQAYKICPNCTSNRSVHSTSKGEEQDNLGKDMNARINHYGDAHIQIKFGVYETISNEQQQQQQKNLFFKVHGTKVSGCASVAPCGRVAWRQKPRSPVQGPEIPQATSPHLEQVRLYLCMLCLLPGILSACKVSAFPFHSTSLPFTLFKHEQ